MDEEYGNEGYSNAEDLVNFGDETQSNRSRRELEGNPLIDKSSKSKPFIPIAPVVVESLGDAVLINAKQLNDLIKSLKSIEKNDKRLQVLEEEKKAFLFSSEDLLKILLEVTPSVKTRIAMINQLAPRLIDPKAKNNEIIGMFRYVEEKEPVEAALKLRAAALERSQYSIPDKNRKAAAVPTTSSPLNPLPPTNTLSPTSMGIRSGRGGRGHGGRGHRQSLSNVSSSDSLSFGNNEGGDVHSGGEASLIPSSSMAKRFDLEGSASSGSPLPPQFSSPTPSPFSPMTDAHPKPAAFPELNPILEAELPESPVLTPTVSPIGLSVATPLEPSTPIPLAPSTETPLAPSTETPLASSTETPLAPSTETPLAPSTETHLASSTETPLAPSTETPLASSTETALAPLSPGSVLSPTNGAASLSDGPEATIPTAADSVEEETETAPLAPVTSGPSPADDSRDVVLGDCSTSEQPIPPTSLESAHGVRSPTAAVAVSPSPPTTASPSTSPEGSDMKLTWDGQDRLWRYSTGKEARTGLPVAPVAAAREQSSALPQPQDQSKVPNQQVIPQSVISSGLVPLSSLSQPESWQRKAREEALRDTWSPREPKDREWIEDDPATSGSATASSPLPVLRTESKQSSSDGDSQSIQFPSIPTQSMSQIPDRKSSLLGASELSDRKYSDEESSTQGGAKYGWLRRRLSAMSITTNCKHFYKRLKRNFKTSSSASSTSTAMSTGETISLAALAEQGPGTDSAQFQLPYTQSPPSPLTTLGEVSDRKSFERSGYSMRYDEVMLSLQDIENKHGKVDLDALDVVIRRIQSSIMTEVTLEAAISIATEEKVRSPSGAKLSLDYFTPLMSIGDHGYWLEIDNDDAAIGSPVRGLELLQEDSIDANGTTEGMVTVEVEDKGDAAQLPEVHDESGCSAPCVTPSTNGAAHDSESSNLVVTVADSPLISEPPEPEVSNVEVIAVPTTLSSIGEDGDGESTELTGESSCLASAAATDSLIDAAQTHTPTGAGSLEEAVTEAEDASVNQSSIVEEPPAIAEETAIAPSQSDAVATGHSRSRDDSVSSIEPPSLSPATSPSSRQKARTPRDSLASNLNHALERQVQVQDEDEGSSVDSSTAGTESRASVADQPNSTGEAEADAANHQPRRRPSITSVSNAKIVQHRLSTYTVGSPPMPILPTSPMQDDVVRDRRVSITRTMSRQVSSLDDASASNEQLKGLAEACTLGMDLKSFLSLEPEGPIGVSAEGLPLLSYPELVRRNFMKQFEGLQRPELQEHLSDAAFSELLGMSKEAFRALPQWRRNDKKKSLMLF